MEKKRKATILDIAALLDVNPSTVSRALNDHPRISKDTKDRVLEAARSLNYEQNHIAAALRKGKSNIVGVIVPKLDRSFFSAVVRGIEEVVNSAGYNVIICQSDDRQEAEAQQIEALLRSQVSGIIISISQGTKSFAHFDKIKEKGIPLILFDRVDDRLKACTVEIDDFQGGYLATKHLIAQACQHIAHFAGPQNLNIYANRLKGYKSALEEAGMEIQEELIIESDLQLEAGRQNMAKLLKLPLRPDAVFSSSDFAAVGAMQVLKEQKISIPDEVAIIGFSDEPFTTFVEPSLTSVKQFSRDMGKEAARLFLENVNNKKQKTVIRKTKLQPELIIRSSSLKQDQQDLEQ